MITKAGQLVEHLVSAAESHNMTPQTDIRVRVGTLGPVYRIKELKGVDDARGRHMLLELCMVPEEY